MAWATAAAAVVDSDRVTAELRSVQEQAAAERTRADRAEARSDAIAAEVERIRDELRAPGAGHCRADPSRSSRGSR